MGALEACDTSTEEGRKRWLGLIHSEHSRDWQQTFKLNVHGLLLQLDIERAFVAGAWGATIVMAQAMIEARPQAAHPNLPVDADIYTLKAVRDELMHPPRSGAPSLLWPGGGADYTARHAALEPHAQMAMRLVVAAVYATDPPAGLA